jgi:hypothetical protein
MWEFTPKGDASLAAFEAAFKAHLEFRATLGDPWEWGVGQVAVGENVGTFYALSGGHSWGDFDSYNPNDFNVAASAHFDATVAPLLESQKNTISQLNAELSILPPEGPNYSVFQVWTFYLKPEAEMAFMEALGTVKQVVQDAGAPMYYSISNSVVGGEGPAISMTTYSEDWAGMAEPDPNMEQLMFEALGEEGAMELFTMFSNSYHRFETSVVVLRPDLMLGGM